MISKLSIVSLILGIISLSTVLVWIFPAGSQIHFKIIGISLFNILIAPLGLILGLTSLSIIKKSELEGKSLAILGILFSLIGIIMLIIIVFAIASSIGNLL